MAKKKVKLDLACGQRKREGFKGVDIVDLPGVDIVFDLEKHPWPLEDDSVDEIFSSHYVEHCRDLVGFMNDVWRICKDEAIVNIYHPYWSHLGAWQDPTHVRALNEKSWEYYNTEAREQMGIDHYDIVADFELVNFHYNIVDKEFFEKPEEERLWHIQHTLNVVSELGVTLRARKP